MLLKVSPAMWFFFSLQNRVIISHTRVIASFADDFEINQRYGIWVFFYLVIFVFIYSIYLIRLLFPSSDIWI